MASTYQSQDVVQSGFNADRVKVIHVGHMIYPDDPEVDRYFYLVQPVGKTIAGYVREDVLEAWESGTGAQTLYTVPPT